MIAFAHPLVFLLLPLPLLVFLLVPPHQQHVTALRVPFFRRLAEAADQSPKPGSVAFRRTLLQSLAACLIWLLLVAALAGPKRIGEPIIEEKAARDVMLAVDISGSMDQVDFTSRDGQRTKRLDGVKNVVGDFISERDGDRVALIVFGARAFVQAPFTEDLASVRALLEQTEVGMAGPHTVLGDAIGLSIKTFQASEIEDRLLIVLSDGADTGSRMTPINAASIAAQEGIEIISIGVGDPGGTGDLRLDEQTLKSIADTAGGAYYFAGDENTLADIYARIDSQKPRSVETQSFRPEEQLSYILLALAALIGIATLATLQLHSRRRRTA